MCAAASNNQLSTTSATDKSVLHSTTIFHFNFGFKCHYTLWIVIAATLESRLNTFTMNVLFNQTRSFPFIFFFKYTLPVVAKAPFKGDTKSYQLGPTTGQFTTKKTNPRRTTVQSSTEATTKTADCECFFARFFDILLSCEPILFTELDGYINRK